MLSNSSQTDRRWIVRYVILTLAIFLPLLWAFRRITNVYPLTSWNVMMSAGDLQRGWNYCLVTGETVAGEKVDVRPAHLTNALYGRTWGLVNATVANGSFKLASIHPSNAELVAQVGGIQNLPPGARIPDLLQAWGKLYNDQFLENSPHRLKAIQLDMYRWDSGRYDNYGSLVRTWRKDL